jgi:hypothetical protein
MSNGRIGTTQSAFDADIKKFNAHLHKLEADGITFRGVTLGLVVPDLDKLSDYRKEWSNDDPASPGLYDKLQNSAIRETSTPTEVREFMKEFRTFFQPLLNIMAASRKITAADRGALNIAPPVTTHVTPTTPIEQKCITSVTMLGGGKAKFVCRPTIDIARASRAEGSDGLIIAYRAVAPIVETEAPAKEATGNELASKIRVKRPDFAGPDDGTIKITQTKATFIIDFGAEKAGYVLQFYTCWINSKHTNLNGPWTGPYSEMIS